MRLRSIACLAALAAALTPAAPARAQDSLAPEGAPKFWLPNEDWVNMLWLPFDEARLYELIGYDRGDVFRWTRDERTIAQLAARRGFAARRLALALVEPRRRQVSPRMYAELVDRSERVLTQGHLGQHILFHALHQTAVPAKAVEIFGTRTVEHFLQLRRAELSPLQICELNGVTRAEAQHGVMQALRDAAAQGVRSGALSRAQATVMLDRQLRSVPRWLGQNRYNGPSGGRNRKLPAADFARHPTISADGTRVVWDAYRAKEAEAEQLGEIHVRGTDVGGGAGDRRRFPVSPPGRRGSRRPRSAYNSVVSADGRFAAFETAESTYPLAKRVGQMTVMLRDLRTGRVSKVSHAHRPRGAPTRTAFNPALSADGRVVAFEATDAGRNGAPSRNGLWVVDRARRRERLIAAGSLGGAYLPRVSGDGGIVVYTAAPKGGDGHTRVYAQAVRGAGGAPATRGAARAGDGHAVRGAAPRTARVSRATGRAGAPVDGEAYEPAASHDGSAIAFTSRATNLGGDPGAADVYVRDLRAGTTEVVSARVRSDAFSPAITPDGRFVVFVSRVGRPNGTPESLRSRIWLYDRATRTTTLVSRADGARGEPADGYSTEPSVSADGRRVVFTSTAGNLADAKPTGLAGVFLRDLSRGTTTLLSTHAPRADEALFTRRRIAYAAGGALALSLLLGGASLALWRRRP